MEMAALERDHGRRLRYLDDGAGMAVLLMPGEQGEHHVYDPQVAPLVDAGFRAVRLDRVGRGQSDWGPFRNSGTSEANDGWALLDHLGVRRAVLVGRSSGSGVVREMYFHQLDRVIGLVSIDSESFGKLYDPSPADLRTDLPLDGGLDPRFDAETTAAYHRNKAELQRIGRLWDYPSDFNTVHCRGWFHEREEIAAQRAALPLDPDAPPDPVRTLEGKWCTVPLFVCASGRGRVGPDDPETAALRTRLPSEDSTLVAVKNCGHWVNVEAVDVFNPAFIAFLKRLDEAERALDPERPRS